MANKLIMFFNMITEEQEGLWSYKATVNTATSKSLGKVISCETEQEKGSQLNLIQIYCKKRKNTEQSNIPTDKKSMPENTSS